MILVCGGLQARSRGKVSKGRITFCTACVDRPAGRLVFTVKLMPGGGLSQWLRAPDRVIGRVGTRVSLFGPLGKAVYRAGDEDNLLFVAGGSGLAPMLSILARAHADGLRAQAQTFQTEGLTRVREEIGPALDAIMAEEGYDLILNRANQAVVMSSDRIDITQLVLERLEAGGAGG